MRLTSHPAGRTLRTVLRVETAITGHPPTDPDATNSVIRFLGNQSGNDAIENIAVVEAHNEQDEKLASTHYLIKWNPRRESPEQWLAYAEEHGHWSKPRPG